MAKFHTSVSGGLINDQSQGLNNLCTFTLILIEAYNEWENMTVLQLLIYIHSIIIISDI